MTSYIFPSDDYRFLFEVLGLADVSRLPGYEEATADVTAQILEEAARFGSEFIQPLNRQSDEIGAKFESGRVTAPPGFAEAYARFSAAGWSGLSGPPAFGGQGLPEILSYALGEILSSNCMSFYQYTGLTHGAALLLERHGSPKLKKTFLGKLVTGEWTGTMCLTESQAGTDLGLIRTKATPNGDGSYSLHGTKIFVSAGEHDMADNIVHFVLARLPDAPAGVKGISLFAVPKFIPDGKGRPGEPNGAQCSSIEHKMGMKGCPACIMTFEGAVGWLIGEPHKGMRAMFTMMNTERLLLSAQGHAAAETAYQSALSYASSRLQGRAAGEPLNPELPADPLLVHADVRRMLATMRTHALGNRALALWVMLHVDIATRHPDAQVRGDADDFVALMTPLVKVWLSENGSEATNLGVQVFGGHGYIREWGMEQLVRDIRVLELYEGANGIQALDFLSRKLPMRNGNMLELLLGPIERHIAEQRDHSQYEDFVAPVVRALGWAREATKALTDATVGGPEELGAASLDYLKIVAYLAQAYIWSRLALAAQADESGQHAEKVDLAIFFFAKMLPRAQAHLRILEAGHILVRSLVVDRH